MRVLRVILTAAHAIRWFVEDYATGDNIESPGDSDDSKVVDTHSGSFVSGQKYANCGPIKAINVLVDLRIHFSRLLFGTIAMESPLVLIPQHLQAFLGFTPIFAFVFRFCWMRFAGENLNVENDGNLRIRTKRIVLFQTRKLLRVHALGEKLEQVDLFDYEFFEIIQKLCGTQLLDELIGSWINRRT